MKTELVEYYFPKGLIWTTVVSTGIFSIYLITIASYGWVLFFIITNLILFGTRYRTVIDTHSKLISDHFYFLFIPFRNEKRSFKELHRLTMDKERTTYKASQRSRDRIADFFSYVGYVEFDHGQRIELLRMTEYDSFKEKMNHLGTQLNLSVDRLF